MGKPLGPLPAEFKSCYRLFLRTLSRAAGNQRPLFHNLRRLWRPAFRTAGRNIMRLNTAQRQEHHEQLRAWITAWDERADGTMMLLSNAARTNGLPLALVRNLASMQSTVRKRHQVGRWNGQLDGNSPVYDVLNPASGTKHAEGLVRTRRLNKLRDELYNPVGEAVKLAEGRNKVMLGRIFQLGVV